MEQKQNSSANNKQVFRDYRLALYQEQLGTVDLEFEDEQCIETDVGVHFGCVVNRTR